MSPQHTDSVLDAIQVPGAFFPNDDKATRDVDRARKLLMKPHDRSKTKRGAHPKPSKADRKRLPVRFAALDVDDVCDYDVQDVHNENLAVFRPAAKKHLGVVEVALPDQFNEIGVDFVFISRPGDVLALDDDIDCSDDDWEEVEDENKRVDDKVVAVRSYAAVLKACPKEH
ncbi:hypothetical protein FRB99_000929 [Tulasnella sp. 403]|nr:hypothetical protein FRB99_000929 [Tulasnella sp. 403]